jgi:hypothetical protein
VIGVASIARPNSHDLRPSIVVDAEDGVAGHPILDGVLEQLLRGEREARGRVVAVEHTLVEIRDEASHHCGRSHFEIELVESGGENVVRILARNRTTPDRARELQRLVDEIGQCSDPFQMYQQFMRRSALREDGGSGLGLARIRAEAEMAVRCDVSGDEVTIVVEGPVELASPR